MDVPTGKFYYVYYCPTHETTEYYNPFNPYPSYHVHHELMRAEHSLCKTEMRRWIPAARA